MEYILAFIESIVGGAGLTGEQKSIIDRCSIFAKHTNVEMQNRIVSFDLSKLTKSMKTTGYLVVLEHIMNKISQNRDEGKNTWIFIDEFHIMLDNKFSADYIERIYKIGRKYGALPTIITQNIEDVLSCEQGLVYQMRKAVL